MLQELKPVLSLLGLCLLGCAGPSAQRATEPDTAPLSVSLKVRAQARGSDEWQPLSPEDVLHSGDRYELTIHNSRPVFLYVAHGLSDRDAQFLLPKDLSTPTHLTARTDTILPAAGTTLELDTQTGEENLYLVAAEQPVAPDKLKDVLTKAAPGEPGKDRERPPDPNNKTRPTDREQRAAPPPVFVAKPVAPGVLALRFTFQHRE